MCRLSAFVRPFELAGDGITLMLVGLLLATVDHALEASPLPMGSAFGVGLP